ncbi:dihydrofolate reductase family protein [Dactylosporangium sp. NPDC000521]|uniref:dihydrofolate reductase family protein n=1 Tax=Dactylosporangium sp. NPDC000521 TaxID=3363975 RepID=UPI0036C75D99
MRKVIVSVFMTLDGVMDNPQDWSLPFWSDDYMRCSRDQLFAADALLMGRVTYEGFAGSWPSRTGDEFADRINNMRKYVASTTLDRVAWTNAQLVSGDVTDAVQSLKQRPGGDLLMYGCGPLARTLAAHGLLDEVRLWVHPIVLGTGSGPFTGWPQTPLTHVATRTLDKGVLILSYAPLASQS